MKTLNFFFLLSFFLLACGGSPEPEQSAEENPGEQISNAINDLQNELGNAVNDLQSENGANKKPINFRKLKEKLPERANGFKRTKAGGESAGALGFKVSTTSATYEKGDQKIEVDLVDVGGIGSAFMGMAAWSMVELDKEDEQGFERTTTYKGHKAFEKCRNDFCEFSVIVAKRFLLTIKGRNVKMDDLHDIADDIGLDDLEDMKDDYGE